MLLTICNLRKSRPCIAAADLYQIITPVTNANAGWWPRAGSVGSLCPEFIGSCRSSCTFPAVSGPWEAVARCLAVPPFCFLFSGSRFPAHTRGSRFTGTFRAVLCLALGWLPRRVGGSTLLCATWGLEAPEASAVPDLPPTPLPLTGMSPDVEGETEPPEFSRWRRRTPWFSWSLSPVHQALAGCDFSWGFRIVL